MGVSVSSVTLTAPLYRGNVGSEGLPQGIHRHPKSAKPPHSFIHSFILHSYLFALGGYEEEVMTDMKMPRFWGESLGCSVICQSE